MRPTTTHRSRSRLAGLSAEPEPEQIPDAPGLPDSPASQEWPDSQEWPEPAGAGLRGPAAPAWLAAPAPGLGRHSRGPGPDPDGPDPDGPDWDGQHSAGTGADGTPPSRIASWLPERWRGARFAINGRGLVVLALLGLVAAAIAGIGVARDQPVAVPVPALPPPPVAAGMTEDLASTASGPAAAPEEIVVSVQGLVGVSGLVRLESGARVADALDAAGGALDGADLRSLNLAQRLGDGDQILVGVAPTDGGPPQLGSATLSAGGPAVSGSAGSVVNINTATAGDLDALPGVGPVTAQSIVDWRAANGRFTSVDQLAEVRGIGPARLASLRELVTV